LYQPFASEVREGDGVSEGGVASYLNDVEIGADTLPALSVQVPDTEAEEESGPP
jgi:hypothetical protein